MKADLSCDDVRIEISARLDDEVDAGTAAAIDAHLAGCAACREYEDSLRSMKRAVALQAAPAVPDITAAVMTRVHRTIAERTAERRSLLRTAVAAALITLLVFAGAVVPWRASTDDVARASEIARAVRGAATEIGSYHATFTVVERGWHPLVPKRLMEAEVWFEAPERLRMEITDRTDYPGPGWPTNDATLVAGPQRWLVEETASCPTGALPGCEVSPYPEVRAFDRRQPFDGSTVLPTDLILPLETLADDAGLRVVGRDAIDGRSAHHVVLEMWQARPLIESLQVAGRWRPFPAGARVDLWLDAETWFPVRFTVASGKGELVVEATSFDPSGAIDPSLLEPSESTGATNGGFQDAPVSTALPAHLAGLEPYRSGVTRDGQQISTFAAGMTWLKVLVDDDTAPTISTFSSELIELGDGFGYIEPSEDALRRSIEILGPEERVRIESNLPRDELIRVAASVPIEGRSITRLRTPTGTVIERVDRDDLATFGYARVPGYLPSGFQFSSAFVSRTAGENEQLTIFYRRPEGSAVMDEIRLIHAPSTEVLPPSSENLVTISADGFRARWAPARSELEWLDGDVYRAVSVPAFDPETATRIARSLSP